MKEEEWCLLFGGGKRVRNISAGVSAAAKVEEMEQDNAAEEEESPRVQYYCGQREKAGGSLNATLRPLWYCEAATAVASERG